MRLWCISFFLIILLLPSGQYLGTAFEGVYAKVIMTICLNACGYLERGPDQKSEEYQGSHHSCFRTRRVRGREEVVSFLIASF